MIQAVLFDMDGVLIDTEKYYRRFDCEAAKEYGYELDFRTACGLRSLDRRLAEAFLKERLGEGYDYEAVRQRRQEMLNRHLKEHGVEQKPFAAEVVRELAEQGYRVAVVTATREERAKEHLAGAGLDGLFAEVISASMVSRGKPFPDVYLYACRKLGVAPEDCVAVEDSPNGVEAAHRAGCRVVMVPDLTPAEEETRGKTEAVCVSLRELPERVEQMNRQTQRGGDGMDFEQAKSAFEAYLDGYDRTDDKINLKIVHTYGVVACAGEIARRMGLGEEDIMLAKLIGLLHDIGRFEQLKRFDSFLPDTMNHAKYGAELLFEEGMIRQFVKEDTWDDIIRTAIDRHSDFAIEGVTEERTLMHAQIIRDADKLDNCRVKLEERIETFMGMSAEEAGTSGISEEVWSYCLDRKSVLASARRTPMDYWVSYVAYFYDIYYAETMQIIMEENYISRTIRRIPYSNRDTAERMEKLEQMLLAYAKEVAEKKLP